MRGLAIGLIAALSFAWGTPAIGASEPTIVIDTYTVTADIESDGTLAVQETVALAPGSPVPTGFADGLATWRVPDEPDRITIGEVRTEQAQGASATITATYTVTGAFRTFTDAELTDGNPLGLKPGDAEMFAEVIGPLADASIRQARIEVRTPGAALAAACFVDGQSIPVCTDRIGDDVTTFRSLDLAASASMTIALVIDGAAVDIADGDTEELPAGTGAPAWLVIVALAIGMLAAVGILVLRRSLRQQ